MSVIMYFFFVMFLIMHEMIFTQCVRNPFYANDISFLDQTLEMKNNGERKPSFPHTTPLLHENPTMSLPLPPPPPKMPPPTANDHHHPHPPSALPSKIKNHSTLSITVLDLGRPPPPRAPSCSNCN